MPSNRTELTTLNNLISAMESGITGHIWTIGELLEG
jgi:hypothetical protein